MVLRSNPPTGKEFHKSTIVVSLASFCTDHDILEKLRFNVRNISEIGVEASVLITINILHCFENGTDWSDLTQNYFRRAVSAIANLLKTDLIQEKLADEEPSLYAALEMYKSLEAEGYTLVGGDATMKVHLDYVTDQMMVNFYVMVPQKGGFSVGAMIPHRTWSLLLLPYSNLWRRYMSSACTSIALFPANYHVTANWLLC
ncbi:hypothetical protein EDD86DRAFT_272363 [Gorgonomyces haynaldii]|nr:hypothetical protein EDD86DRAFT_272363 [Gorgonomyces haynaldii]